MSFSVLFTKSTPKKSPYLSAHRYQGLDGEAGLVLRPGVAVHDDLVHVGDESAQKLAPGEPQAGRVDPEERVVEGQRLEPGADQLDDALVSYLRGGDHQVHVVVVVCLLWYRVVVREKIRKSQPQARFYLFI